MRSGDVAELRVALTCVFCMPAGNRSKVLVSSLNPEHSVRKNNIASIRLRCLKGIRESLVERPEDLLRDSIIRAVA